VFTATVFKTYVTYITASVITAMNHNLKVEVK